MSSGTEGAASAAASRACDGPSSEASTGPATAAGASGDPGAREERPAVFLPFPPGHFYSPIVDPGTLDVERLWPERPEVIGIDFNDRSHEDILTRAFPRFRALYDYPDRLPQDDALRQFYTRNSQFSWLDARALFVLLHAWRPRRIVEVGSGFSSLLIADVNERYMGGRMHVTCIEPYPRPFLARGLPGVRELLVEPVQSIPLARFSALQAGDLLFVDSSHVAKTGSDVNFLFFEVLPRLASGVLVHFHDIFLPHDYPRAWVMEENRSWNEQYVLRALLTGGERYEVLFGCTYAFTRFRDLVIAALDLPDRRGFGGGSFWIRKR